jgi:oligopeptide/dipeptide ABC transporter ATP-binding protein
LLEPLALTVEPLIVARRLKKHFPVRSSKIRWPFAKTGTWIRAVDDVSFSIMQGQTLGLVGESGCGKTTTGKLMLRLEQPTAGTVEFLGKDIAHLSTPTLRQYRSSVQAVFQDPASSLNPRMRIGDFVAEPLEINTKLTQAERKARVHGLLAEVGLASTTSSNFPHEFSGGERQRIALARAVSLNPRLIVLDEPVSALDVSIRAQIMNLLKDLQDRHGMSYLLIAHNLATVRYLSHRVAVMYLGQIVEEAAVEDLFTDPLHPYTKALISAALPTQPGEQSAPIILGGEAPSPIDPPSGCRFRTRCPFAFERCQTEQPEFRELAAGHSAACHLY